MKPGQVSCACGKAYWPNQGWKHASCAINTQPAINADAINRSAEEVTPHSPHRREPSDQSGPHSVTGVAHPKTRNRRTREAYNAYMREYMRLKRAGFIGIAYG